MYSTLKKCIPMPIKHRTKNILKQWYYTLSGYQVQCNICKWKDRQFRHDGLHEGTRCPNCGSVVRHRLFWAMIYHNREFHHSKLLKGKTVLHFAPEKYFQPRLPKLCAVYDTADFFAPGYEHKYNTAKNLDLSDMSSVPDNSYDCLLAFDVLEHVHDHLRAMSEIYRVLRPAGFCILTVPQKDDLDETFEDLTITDPSERERVFGQDDHVRLYGNDFADMLREKGFKVSVFDKNDLAPEIVTRHVLFPPVLSTDPLVNNYRKIFVGRKA